MIFFFSSRRRHTRSDRDWSSDVCSSDLFRLLLASAERRIKEAKVLLALGDLERVAQEPRASEGDLPAYVLALRWAATTRVGDAAAATELEQTLATTIENPVLRELVVSTVTR